MKYCTIHELARRSILSSLRERVLSSLSFWILIILLLSSGSIYAEQPKDTSGLLQQSLLHDISSFSGEMLETWVTSLGLAPARTDAENRNILESWYEIPIAADEKEIPHVDHVETFLIKQANSMQIMPKEETDSFIIILSGQVEISYKQQGVDDAAVVVADSITINSETGLVYATGNVGYHSTTSSDSTESLTSQHLVFYLSTGFSIYQSGQLAVERDTPENETMRFIVRGDSILRDMDGHIIIEQGSVSTDPIDPYLTIHADTIKILKGGDWFAEHAVVSIGHVPVMYVPFFYYPGNTLFINPSFGFSSDRGFYLNTTIHILGSPPTKNKPAETSFASYFTIDQQDRSIGLDGNPYRGLFSQTVQNWALESASYIDVQADVYELEGIVVGSKGSLAVFDAATLVYQTAVAYDPISQPISLGVMIDPTLTVTRDQFSMNVRLPWYSSPDIKDSFTRRISKFDIQDTFGTPDFPSTSGTMDTFTWELDTRLSFRTTQRGLIEMVSIPTLTQELNWAFGDDAIPRISDIELMNHDLRVGGTLLDLRDTVEVQNDQNMRIERTSSHSEAHEPQLIRDQFSEDHAVQMDLSLSSGRYDEYFMILPEILTDRPFNHVIRTEDATSHTDTTTLISFATTYSLRDRGGIEVSVSDANMLEYSYLSGELTGSLSTRADISSGAIQIDYTLFPRLSYATHTNHSMTSEDFSVITSQDPYDTTLLVRGDLKVSLQSIGLDYRLRNRVGELIYDEGLGYHMWEYGAWDDSDILEHAISGNYLLFESQRKNQALMVSYRLPLPPDTVNANASLTYSQKALTGKGGVTYAFDDDADKWYIDGINGSFRITPLTGVVLDLMGSYDMPGLDEVGQTEFFDPLSLTLTGSYASSDKRFTIRQKIYWDLSHSAIEGSLSEISLDDLVAQFSTKWVLDDGSGGPGVVPSRLHVRYTGGLPSLVFWRNRIGVDFSILADWEYDFQQAYDNLLSIRCEARVGIFEFMDLTVSTISLNTSTDAYVSGQVNPIWDLIRSFNFFSLQDRYESGFKLDSVEVALVHYMKDWNLYVDYTGSFAYSSSDNRWRWEPTTSVYIKWKAFPEIDLKTTIEHDTVTQSPVIMIE